MMKSKYPNFLSAPLASASLAVMLGIGLFSCKVTEEDRWGRWDADSNSAIDRNEFGTAWGEAGYYSRWDANRDGFIAENEWRAGRNTYMSDYDESRFGTYSDWDVDTDGQLSQEEFRDGVFDVYDADRDGTLAQAEYNSWWGTFNRSGGM